MEKSTVTIKGQLLIPERLRDKYGIQFGVRAAFVETKDGIIIKVMNKAFNQFAGFLKEVVPTTEEYKTWRREDKIKEDTITNESLKGTNQKANSLIYK